MEITLAGMEWFANGDQIGLDHQRPLTISALPFNSF